MKPFNLTRNGQVVVRVIFVLLLIAVGVFAMQEPFRGLEALAATKVLQALGTKDIFWSGSSGIGIIPRSGPAFQAIVTVPCSALPSLLALTSLAAPIRFPRRGLALIGAMATIWTGNIIRIAASVAVGVFAGRSSLILFHDWVGSVFAFAYTLGGYILLVYILLPKNPGSRERSWISIFRPPWRGQASSWFSSRSAGV